MTRAMVRLLAFWFFQKQSRPRRCACGQRSVQGPASEPLMGLQVGDPGEHILQDGDGVGERNLVDVGITQGIVEIGEFGLAADNQTLPGCAERLH